MSASTTLERVRAKQPTDNRGPLRHYLSQNVRQYAMMGVLAAIVVIFQILTDGRLLSPNCVADLIRQNAYVLILGIGMVMIIVAQHIDLSVGSVVAFVGGLCALMMAHWHWSWPLAVLASIAIGGLVGCWQGFWIAYVGIPAFIVTLGGMLLFRGLAILLVGTTVAVDNTGFKALTGKGLPNAFGFLGGELDVLTLLIGAVAITGLVVAQVRQRRALIRHELRTEPRAAVITRTAVFSAMIAYATYLLAQNASGTPIVLVIVGVLIILYTFVMGGTVFGRHIYAMGGNLAAARLSGVQTKRVNFMLFVNMGLLAGVTAVLCTARSGAAGADAGMNFELDAIAAAFIGGTAVTGGIGRISGAVIGALIMGVLNMGLSLVDVASAWQMVIKGLVLIVAVSFDIVYKRMTSASQ